MIFILFGSVNYPIAVIVRTIHFSTIFMVEGSVIIILIIRQVIILKVIIEHRQLSLKLLRIKKNKIHFSQPVWFCNMNHEKSSCWLKCFIAFGSFGVVIVEYVVLVYNYGHRGRKE